MPHHRRSLISAIYFKCFLWWTPASLEVLYILKDIQNAVDQRLDTLEVANDPFSVTDTEITVHYDQRDTFCK